MNDTERQNFPLLQAREKEELTISEIRGGGRFKEKCISQALIPGQKIQVLRNSGRGACIVLVKNTKVMISHGMLNRIIVSR